MIIAFWGIALLLTAGAVLLLLLPLLRPARATVASPAMEEARLAIFDQQLKDLEADVANGLLDASQFERARADLERSLIEDSADAEEPVPSVGTRTGNRVTAAVLVLAVPALALVTYLQVGSGVAGLEPARQTPVTAAAPEHDMERLVNELHARLMAEPDPEGFALLARSQASLGRFDEALRSYARALELGADRDPSVLAQYADLLAFTTDDLQGRPLELVEQALALDPDHPQALWLAGTAAYRVADYATARQHWERLLAILPPGSDSARTIEGNLQDVEQRIEGGVGR
jgi:cytochrome c-type biogenesis protein CcmH